MAEHPHFLWADILTGRNKKSPLIELLRANALFCTLTTRELRILTNMVYERVYQAEEVIFHQNDRGFGMYVIAKGRIAIKSQDSSGETLVTILGKGSFFGELSLVDPENIRTATAVATERTVLIGFFKPDLMEILERRPAMGVKILLQISMVLASRLIDTTEKLLLLSNAPQTGKAHGEAS